MAGGNPLASLLGGALGGGAGLGEIFEEDPDFEGVDDYVVEKTDEAGHHMRKEVHKGNGWTSIEISNGDEGMGGSPFGAGGPFGGSDPFGDGDDPMGDFMGDLIGAIMMEQMQMMMEMDKAIS